MLVKVHFTFNGEAKEALNFYQRVFGGAIKNLIHYADAPTSPMTNGMKEENKNRIMNSRLEFDHTIIGICDSPTELETNSGNLMSMDIASNNESRLKHIFNSFAKEGTIIMPLTETFFSPNYGIIVDKFGIKWIIMQYK